MKRIRKKLLLRPATIISLDDCYIIFSKRVVEIIIRMRGNESFKNHCSDDSLWHVQPVFFVHLDRLKKSQENYSYCEFWLPESRGLTFWKKDFWFDGLFSRLSRESIFDDPILNRMKYYFELSNSHSFNFGVFFFFNKMKQFFKNVFSEKRQLFR